MGMDGIVLLGQANLLDQLGVRVVFVHDSRRSNDQCFCSVGRRGLVIHGRQRCPFGRKDAHQLAGR